MPGLIKKVDIKSYRGISSLKLKDIQKINILTGDNNSGKTSVLEVLKTFGQPDIIDSWIEVSRSGGIWRDISVYEGMNDLFDVNSQEKKVEYSINAENSCTKVEIVGFDSKKEISEKEYQFITRYIVLSDDEKENERENFLLVDKTDFEIKINNVRTDFREIVEGQRGRSLSLKEGKEEYFKKVVYISPFKHIEGDFFLKDVLNSPELYEEMLEVLKEFDAGIISINYDEGATPGRSGVYKILSKKNNKALPLNMYGDGMKKAILLMSAVIKAKDGILLLDEFETAIHTSAMDKVFEWILNTCLKLNVQVFMTSHSMEAIEKVLSCSEELQEHMAIYTLYKDEDGNTARRMSAQDALRLKNQMGLELR